MSDAEHIFMGLLAICMSSLEKNVCLVLLPLFDWVVLFCYSGIELPELLVYYGD